MTTDESYRSVKSAGRALDVLEALAAPAGPRSPVELSRALGIPKSSLHAILRTLLDREWVAADPTGTRFSVGLRALEVGAAFLAGADAAALYEVTLDRLAEHSGETVQLYRLDRGSVVLLARRDSAHIVRPVCAVGRRLPAHATAAGKALLAARTDEEVDRLLQWPLPAVTGRTVTTPEALRAELAAVRRRGWAEEWEECSPGLAAVAVAVPLREPAVDAIAVAAPVDRLGPEARTRLAAVLREAAVQARTARALLAPNR
ncbi:IclR family transcriptional regulator [Micromonospora matsumotoense]|uniref:IclR family transcriptional regulator n=1 Tax=Micromonospora matsumotoense TaxID=121616 RepID=UPI00344157BA